jgi:hypothetical protein
MSQNPACQSQPRRKRDLIHLNSLPHLQPLTSTGTVAWIWPEVEAALSTGKKLREVWDAASNDGLNIPYPQFRVYVSRLRKRSRRDGSKREPTPPTTAASVAIRQHESPPPNDPFRNLREQRQKNQSDGFHYDPFSIQKPLID